MELLFIGFNSPDVILSLNRIVLGVAFSITGYHKCCSPERHAVFVKTVQECVPNLPGLPGSAWFICSVELLGGLALVVGLLSPLAALGLLVVTTVAVCTNAVKRIPSQEPEDKADWVFYFLYLPEVLWTVMLLVVIVGGPGKLSLDHYIGGLLQ